MLKCSSALILNFLEFSLFLHYQNENQSFCNSPTLDLGAWLLIIALSIIRSKSDQLPNDHQHLWAHHKYFTYPSIHCLCCLYLRAVRKLVLIAADFRWSSGRTQATILTHVYTYGQFRVPTWTNLWTMGGNTPRGNPCTHIQRFEHRTLLCSNSAKYCTTVPHTNINAPMDLYVYRF